LPPGAAFLVICDGIKVTLAMRHNLTHGGDQEAVPRGKVMGLRALIGARFGISRSAPGGYASAMASLVSTVTPGPMVELSAIFFT